DLELAGSLVPGRSGRGCEREDGEAQLLDLVEVAYGPVDHEARQPAIEGELRHPSAPQRASDLAAGVDDEHRAGRGALRRPPHGCVLAGGRPYGEGRAGQLRPVPHWPEPMIHGDPGAGDVAQKRDWRRLWHAL